MQQQLSLEDWLNFDQKSFDVKLKVVVKVVIDHARVGDHEKPEM